MKPHLPFYCGLIVALVLLLVSISPPTLLRSQSVLIAQPSARTIEACVKGMQSEIDAGYDSLEERKRLPQEMGRLTAALKKLRAEYDRKASDSLHFIIAAAGSLMLGGLLSQALVIRALKRRFVEMSSGQPSEFIPKD